MQNAEKLASMAAVELMTGRFPRPKTRKLADYLNAKSVMPEWGGDGFDTERWRAIAKIMKVRLHDEGDLVLWAVGMKGFVSLSALSRNPAAEDATKILCEAIIESAKKT